MSGKRRKSAFHFNFKRRQVLIIKRERLIIMKHFSVAYNLIGIRFSFRPLWLLAGNEC